MSKPWAWRFGKWCGASSFFAPVICLLVTTAFAIFVELHPPPPPPGPEEQARIEEARRVAAQEREARESWERFQKHCTELRDKKIVDLTTRDAGELQECGDKVPFFMLR